MPGIFGVSFATTITTPSKPSKAARTLNGGPFPSITLTSATPSRPTTSKPNPNGPCRLLYRGSLSLTDSEMLLDGISFTTSDTSSTSLESAPLPLKLETQRNRLLKFVGIVELGKLDGVLDEENAVRMYIHPLAKLSVSFFEMLFCTKGVKYMSRTDVAVRIGIGEAHNPNDSDLFIYGRPSPISTTSSSKPTMELYLAQLRPKAASPVKSAFARHPRPDDPTPRLPPPQLLKPRLPGSPGRRGMKRVRSESAAVGESERKRAKGRVVLDVRGSLGKGKVDSQGFRIPDDPFVASNEDNEMPSAVEAENKELVRQVTRKVLDSYGVTRSREDYREVQGYIYRGTLFALRNDVKSEPLKREKVGIIVERHAGMYITT